MRPSRTARPRFVIQKHDASTLHYDLRFEADGVLKSWAVPKGPSTDPRVKRLALPTPDHDLGHFDFEGVIGRGEYGSGAVIVWDVGTYENRTTDADGDEVPVGAAIEAGHLVVAVRGEKLRGGYALTRTGADGRWLLVKMVDEEADAARDPVSREPRSVLTGRSIEEVAEEAGA
jgi:DNA ligase D-like protein (predicted 3'-phosphoesterase)